MAVWSKDPITDTPYAYPILNLIPLIWCIETQNEAPTRQSGSCKFRLPMCARVAKVYLHLLLYYSELPVTSGWCAIRKGRWRSLAHASVIIRLTASSNHTWGKEMACETQPSWSRCPSSSDWQSWWVRLSYYSCLSNQKGLYHRWYLSITLELTMFGKPPHLGLDIRRFKVII